MRILNGYVYVDGDNPDTGDHCVLRFPVKYMFAEHIPFQVLFTWEIDWGDREEVTDDETPQRNN